MVDSSQRSISPLVSIITPAFNAAGFMPQAIVGIQSQTFENWELIIIDDRSTDDSFVIAKRYAEQDTRIRAMCLEKNSGSAVARNTGIELARGRYIAFCDSDDSWLPNKLERQLSIMQSNNLAFSWASYNVVTEQNKFIRIQPAKNLTYKQLLNKSGVIGCLTAMYDSQVMGKQFMPLIHMRQDYGLWLKLLRISEKNGLHTQGIPDVLANYHLHRTALTKNKLKAAYYQWRLYRDIEHLPVSTATLSFFNYFLHGALDRFTKAPK